MFGSTTTDVPFPDDARLGRAHTMSTSCGCNRGSLHRWAHLEPPGTPKRLLRWGIVAAAWLHWGSLPVAAAESSTSETSSKSIASDVTSTTRSNSSESGVGVGDATGSRSTLATRLELDLPVGCGTLGLFVERLRARSDRIRFADQGANRIVQARITSDASGTFRATMTLSYPDGHSSSRIIEASSCNEAIEALALVTAVTLDPLSVSPGINQPTPRPTKSDRPEPSKWVEPNAARTLPTPERHRPQKPPPAGPGETILGVGVSFAAYRGPSPGWLKGFEPNIRVMRSSQMIFSPSIRLGFSYAENRGITATGGIADFALASTTIDLCPWQVLLHAVEMRSCALLHAGIVIAQGRVTHQPESHRRPFWALGASGEVIVTPSKSFGFPIRATASIPVVRDTYAFDPATFYVVPGITYGITAGLEIRFR
jgi:hypothetical protein